MKTIIKILVPLLLVAFVVLKLCNIITWSWWWVLSPIWIVVLCAIIIFIVAFSVVAHEERKAKKL